MYRAQLERTLLIALVGVAVSQGHSLFYQQPAVFNVNPGYQYQDPYQPYCFTCRFTYKPYPPPTPQYQPLQPLVLNPIPPVPPLIPPLFTPQLQNRLIRPFQPKDQPLFVKAPESAIIIPVKDLRGSFPPFIERLVQRIQTYYSVYNPPETLTIPTRVYKPTTQAMTVCAPTTESTTTPKEDNETTSQVNATSPPTKNIVSTLTVYEITPSETTTTVGPETTTAAEETTVTTPVDAEGTTEEPNFISPENASFADPETLAKFDLPADKRFPYPFRPNEMSNDFIKK